MGILIGPLLLKDFFSIFYSIIKYQNKNVKMEFLRFLFEDTSELVNGLLHFRGLLRLAGYERLFGCHGIKRPELFDIKEIIRENVAFSETFNLVDTHQFAILVEFSTGRVAALAGLPPGKIPHLEYIGPGASTVALNNPSRGQKSFPIEPDLRNRLIRIYRSDYKFYLTLKSSQTRYRYIYTQFQKPFRKSLTCSVK
jgi:hypothetical protein